MDHNYDNERLKKNIENADYISLLDYHPYKKGYYNLGRIQYELGTIQYLNFCMKVVSKWGAEIQNIPVEYRTKPICIAAVINLKSEGCDCNYALKYIPEKYRDECRAIYQFSQKYYNDSESKKCEKIEDAVRIKMKQDFQDYSKQIEAFEKVINHIKNFKDLGESLDKLYTLMLDLDKYESLDDCLNGEKWEKNKHLTRRLSKKIQE